MGEIRGQVRMLRSRKEGTMRTPGTAQGSQQESAPEEKPVRPEVVPQRPQGAEPHEVDGRLARGEARLREEGLPPRHGEADAPACGRLGATRSGNEAVLRQVREQRERLL